MDSLTTLVEIPRTEKFGFINKLETIYETLKHTERGTKVQAIGLNLSTTLRR